MAQDEFAYVYRLLRAESPVFPLFFIALNFVSIRVERFIRNSTGAKAQAQRTLSGMPRKLCRNFVRLAKRQNTSAQPPKPDLRKSVPNPNNP